MDRHRVREGPDHGTRLGVAERRATVLDGHPLDAAGQVGLPVLALGRRLLLVGEIVPPAELLQQVRGELRVAVLDLGADRIGLLGQQIHTIALDPEARPEGQPTLGDRLGCVVQVRGTRMPHLGRSPAGPGQP